MVSLSLQTLLCASLLARISAFTVRNSRRHATSLRMADKASSDLNKLVDSVKGLNVQSANLEAIKSNVMEGDWGARGEVFTIAQFAVLGSILLNGIPVVGDVGMLLLGCALFLGGSFTIFLTAVALDTNLSPWPVPTDTNKLQTDGLYSQVRHPMYSGLLAACAGLSILTGSVPRLVLTILLYVVLDAKTQWEEDALQERHPEYSAYRRIVPHKFVPASVWSLLEKKE